MRNLFERITWKRAGVAVLSFVLAVAITIVIFHFLIEFMTLGRTISANVQTLIPAYVIPETLP